MDGNFPNGYHGYHGGRNFSRNEKYDSDGPVPDYDDVDDNRHDVRLARSPQRDYEDDVAMATRIGRNGHGQVTEREYSRRSQRYSREGVNRESTESHGRYIGNTQEGSISDTNRDSREHSRFRGRKGDLRDGHHKNSGEFVDYEGNKRNRHSRRGDYIGDERDYVNHVADLNRKLENGRNGRPVSGWQNGKNDEKVNGRGKYDPGIERNGQQYGKINSSYEQDYSNRREIREDTKYEVGDLRNVNKYEQNEEDEDRSQLSHYRPRTHGVSRALTLKLQRSMRRTHRGRRGLAGDDHDVPKLSYADGIKTIVQRRKHVQRPALSQIGTAFSSNLSGDGNDSEDIGLPSNRMNRKTKTLGRRLTALQRRREVNAHDMATLLRLALYEFFYSGFVVVGQTVNFP